MQQWALVSLGSGDFLCNLKLTTGFQSSVRGIQRLMFTGRNQLAGLPPDLVLVKLLCLRVCLVLSLQIPRLVYNTGFLVLRESEVEGAGCLMEHWWASGSNYF